MLQGGAGAPHSPAVQSALKAGRTLRIGISTRVRSGERSDTHITVSQKGINKVVRETTRTDMCRYHPQQKGQSMADDACKCVDC